MNSIRAIIFDFDGIIVESVDIKTQAFAELYQFYGDEIVQKVIAHHEANGGMSRYEKIRHYHNSYLGIPISYKEVESFASRFSKIVMDKVVHAPYVDGALEFLENYNTHYDFFISTGTPQSEIESILTKRNIRHYFKRIWGSPVKKTEHVKSILREFDFRSGEVIFVGDAPSDIEAAQANALEFIGRYTTAEQIKEQKHTIKSLFELEKTINRVLDERI